MSVIVLTSAHGAPGVTTTALALTVAWPSARVGRRVLLVDADPAGSGLLSGSLRNGVPDSAGVSVLAAARPPLSAEQVVACAVALDEHATRMVLPGVVDPAQARPLASMWGALAEAARELSGLGVDVLVDMGRLGHRHEPSMWLTAADLLAVVLRGDLGSVLPAAAALRTLAGLRGSAQAPVGVVVDLAGYSTAEITAATGASATLTIPRDDWAARALADGALGGLRLDRSPLMRAARSLAAQIATLVPEPAVTA